MDLITVEDIKEANPTLVGPEALEVILAISLRVNDFYRYDSDHDKNIDLLVTNYIRNHAYIENPIGKYYSPDPIHVLRWEYFPTTNNPNDYYVGIFGFVYTNGLVLYTLSDVREPLIRLWVSNDTVELFRYPEPDMEGYKKFLATLVGKELVEELSSHATPSTPS